MTTEMVAIDRERLAKATRKGLIAAGLLAILSVVEYIVAVEVEQPLLPLLPFVILKGWIILDSFMHIKALWQEGH
jgi:cytochrome c oxidase subunit IV